MIRETNGETKGITIRKIAQRAGVGTGLVNHYFKSKDHLIEVCVQTIISGVIHSFRPICESNEPVERTKCAAKQVMDFLLENSQISRISILGDLKQPKAMDNTMKTVVGFGASLSGGRMAAEHTIDSFLITAILQVAFLRKDVLKESLGIDFNDKEQRDGLIDTIVERFGEK